MLEPIKIKENFASEIKKNGVALINHQVLSDETIEKVKNIIDENNAYSPIDKLVLPSSLTQKLVSLLKFNFSKFKTSNYLKKISEDLNLPEIAELYFDNKTILRQIDCYKSKKSNSFVIPWHCDKAHSGQKLVKKSELTHPGKFNLKFFFFLTDVNAKNGSLAYLPKSHHVVWALKICMLKNELDYKPFWALKDCRNLLMEKNIYKKVKNYVDEETIEDFLEKSSFLEESNDTQKFDLSIPKGGLLIFNELGFHRGSQPLVNNRYALRFFYNNSSFF